jgi:hypothetical protein
MNESDHIKSPPIIHHLVAKSFVLGGDRQLEIERLRAELQAAKQRQTTRQHRPRVAPPNGLRTLAEAAAKLGCSIKTLKGHIASGALNYVALGHGTARQQRRFTDTDLDAFIEAQTRKDIACLSDATRARRTGSTIFKSEVIAFSARRNARPDAKPKR